MRADAPSILKEARLAADLTQAELGKLAFNLQDEQAAYNAVSRMEKGEASFHRIIDAAGALGLGWEAVVEFVLDEPG